ncbi:MAG: hypothetical protein RLZZ481_833 [Pseudomonadota bacterium]
MNWTTTGPRLEGWEVTNTNAGVTTAVPVFDQFGNVVAFAVSHSRAYAEDPAMKQRAELIAQAPAMWDAIVTTVSQNLHLADGDNCTLIELTQILKRMGVEV